MWTGEGVRLSLYTHILILLLPTILDNVLSTLNKIVPSDKSCRSVKFNSRTPSAQELMALLQGYKLAMFWGGEGVVKTTTFYLKCVTFAEDCMVPRPGLNQVFFVKKMGDREIKCWVWF